MPIREIDYDPFAEQFVREKDLQRKRNILEVDYDPFAQDESFPAATPPKRKALQPPAPESSTLGGVASALGQGIAEGVTTALPSMAGEAMEFVGAELLGTTVEGIGRDLKEWADAKSKTMYGEPKKREGLERWVYEGSKMLAPSLIPAGAIGTGIRVLTGVGKLVKAGKAAQVAGDAVSAAKYFEAATKAANLSNNVASASTAGLFGASQAQSTRDTAENRAAKLEAAGDFEGAVEARKAGQGWAPYVSGAIEASGEFFGTKYLGKLFRLDEAGVAKRGAKQLVSDFLKTLGVEVGTEIGQQGGEAYVEKVSGIRPDADPLAEALDVIGPTAFMTLLTGGAAGAVNRMRRDPSDSIDLMEEEKDQPDLTEPIKKAIEKAKKEEAKAKPRPSTAKEAAEVFFGPEAVENEQAIESLRRRGLYVPEDQAPVKSAEESAQAFEAEQARLQGETLRAQAPPERVVQRIGPELGKRIPSVGEMGGGALPEAARAEEELPLFAEPASEIEKIDQQANEAATSPLNDRPQPTEGQKSAGNYKKGKLLGSDVNPALSGLEISIENPRYSERSGTDKDGKPWSQTMQHPYGYFKGTTGKDKDHIDVFIGPDPESEKAFIVDQIDPKTGKFDEHKTLIGFASEEEARAGYLDNYEDGWQGLGAITEMPVGKFKEWLKSGRKTKPVSYKEAQNAEGLRGNEGSVLLGEKRGVEDEKQAGTPILGQKATLRQGAGEGSKNLELSEQGQPGRAGEGLDRFSPVFPVLDSGALESAPDNVSRAIEKGGNLTSTLSGIPKGTKLNRVDTDNISRKLIANVLGLRDVNPEIFRSIVEAIPVDMVNDLVSSKRSPYEFFSDKSVLKDKFSVDPQSPVTGLDRRIAFALLAGIKGVDARLAAKFSFIPDIAWVSQKDLAAKVTSEFFHEGSLQQQATEKQEKQAGGGTGERAGLTPPGKETDRDKAIAEYVEKIKEHSPNTAQSMADKIVAMIDAKDNVGLRDWMNGINPNINRLFTKLTGLPAKTQKDADASLRSMNPEKWDDAQTKKKERKAAEQEARAQKELDRTLEEQVNYNGKEIISRRALYDRLIADGYREIRGKKKGAVSEAWFVNPDTSTSMKIPKGHVEYVRAKIIEKGKLAAKGEGKEGEVLADKTGAPLIVYRGADADGVQSMSEEGIFFTDSKKAAETYGKASAYSLSMENPLTLDAEGRDWQTGFTIDGELMYRNEIVEKARNDGRDGVIVKNVLDYGDAPKGGDAKPHDVYIVFDRSQINDTFGRPLTVSESQLELREEAPAAKEPVAPPAKTFNSGDRVTWTGANGETLTGTVEYDLGPGKYAVNTDQIKKVGGVPIGRVETVSAERLNPIEEAKKPAAPAAGPKPEPQFKKGQRVEFTDFRTRQRLTGTITQDYVRSAVTNVGITGDDGLHHYAEPEKIQPITAAATPSFGAGNKFFTEDKAAKAREILKKKLGGLNMGVPLDPEIIQAGIDLAGYYIEGGSRTFKAYAGKMIEDLGDMVRPYLKSFYLAVRNYPGFDKAGMNTEAELDAVNEETLDTAGKKSILEVKGGEQNASHGIAPEAARTAEDDRAGLEGQGTENVPPIESGRGVEPVREGEGKRPDAELHPGGERDRDEAVRAEGTEGPAGEGEATEHGTKRGVARKPRNVAGVQRRDYRIADGELTRSGAWKKQAETNLDAIELVKKLESENRLATPEEQSILVKYTGWGASELANNMFPGYSQTGKVQTNWLYGQKEKEWGPLVERMLSLLTEEEIKTAARSTQYAHYTSESVIRSIYKALDQFGFNGGKILEPGMGIGHFAGLLPENMKSSYTGIEMDHLTAAIAKHLYQKQNVLQEDFTKLKLPDNFFDLAIGNPPFSRTVILSDPDYKKNRFKLHDYFFAKSMDKVRPGGLLVFISSRYTMDKQGDKARKWLNERADLLGAIRLPQTAFKQNAGTEVVTDVLFLRKKAPGEETTGQPWMELKEVKPDKGTPVMVNEYFADHPEMVLGRHSREGSMYGKDEYTVLPHDGNIEDHFTKAVESLPKAIYSIARKTSEDQKAAVIERDFNPKNKKEGGLYLADDGKLMIVDKGSGAPVSALKTKLDPKEIKWLKEYVKVRDALKQAQYDQLNDLDWETSLAAANKAYDDFVKKHGRIKDFTVYERTIKDEDGNEQTTEYRRYKNEKLWKIDIESQLVLALEDITEEDEVVKGPFLLGRTIRKPTRPDVKSVPDALAVSLDEIGRLDIDYVANVAGLPREEVIDRLGELIYEEPGQDGYQLSDEYLSGDVVKKLDEARAAAKVDPKYQRNVDALAKVQPAPLTPKNITVILGANWIPVEHYNDFAEEVIGLAGPDIMFDTRDNSWRVEVNKESGYGYRRKKAKVGTHQLRSATSEWGTQDRGPNELLASVLNNATIKVTKTEVVGGKRRTYTDEAATAQANEKAKLMRERFRTWVWEDAERAAELLNLYNTRFNNIAGRRFDGSHLTLPGVSLKWNIHDHQKRAIWRIIQSGNTYLGHAVGAGKTFEMIAAGMEMRRLGQIRKPLYVVPNHMLQQFASEFQEFYPLAHIMVADEENFHTDNRRRFVAQAALNDPDAIVMTHSSFGLLKMKAENIAPVRDKTLNELREALESMEEDDEPRYKIKRMEQRIEQAEQRFDSLIASEGKDDVITFEEMGADFLFVDEAHNFRKLDFVTNRQAKGIDPVGSRRAVDLYIKSRWLEQQRPGRSHVFASGTPVTNTLGELFTLMRFFIEDQMDKDGINHFDSWANMFGIVQPDYEMNAAGRYEIVERFASFVNVPELMARVRTFMDVLTWSQLKDFVKVPDIAGGKPEIVMAPPSAAMKAYQRDVLLPRIKASRNWKPSPQQKGNPDPLINIITDGRLASIDMRFVDPKAKNDPKSKLNTFIDGIIETYKKTKDLEYINPETKETDSVKGAAQIVFYNHGFGKMVAKNRGFDARAWVMKRLKDAKIPTSEVAWIEDYETAPKKEAMFKEIRQGKKKILIGSAKKMGTGVNVQRRLIAQHYLDPPWYPADVEQPDGRIIRQGNQNKALDRAVTMKRYATKGSYDATMWQMVARKARMIEQAFLGDASVRKLDDISESSQYEMAAALASGDERSIQIAGMKADAERLSRLQEAHYQDQSKLRGDKGSYEYHLKWKEGRLKDIEEAKKVLPGFIYGSFEGKVGGKDFDNRAEFGEALITAYNTAVQKNQKVKGTHRIADIKGAPIVLDIEQYAIGKDTYKYEYHLGLKPTEKYFVKIESGFVINPETTDAKGLATRIVNAINGVDRDISDTEREIEEYKEKLQKVNKKLGAPFEHEQELVEKVAEVARLERELAAEGATEELAEAQQQAETKVAEARQIETIKETRPDELAAIKKQVLEDWEDYVDRVPLDEQAQYPIWLAKHARAEAILSQYDKAGDLKKAQDNIRLAFDSWESDFAEEGQETPAELTEARNVIQGISQGQTKMFPDLMYSIRDQHRIGALRPAKLSDVKKFFPGQEVGLDANKNIYVKTRGGKYVTLYKVDMIDPDTAVLQAGYGTQKLAPGAVIPGAMGVTHAGDIYIKLHRTFGDTWTLAHESMHFMETAGIINDRDVDVLKNHIKNLHRDGRWDTANRKDIGGPEDRANFIADRLAIPEQRGPIGRIILRIRAFIDGILEAFGVRSPESILRGIESGRIFSRKTGSTNSSSSKDQADSSLSNTKNVSDFLEIVPQEEKSNINLQYAPVKDRLGSIIKKAFKSNEVMDVLLNESEAQSGPSDGGCLIAAKAMIHAAGGGKLVRLTSELNGGQTEHYGAMIRDRIYDADGSYANGKEWASHFAKVEMINDRTLEYAEGYDPESDIPDDPRATKKIAQILMKKMSGGEQYAPAFIPRSLAPMVDSIAQPGILQRAWDEFRFQAQDKFHYLNKAQLEAERRSRAALPEAQDAYLAETRYHGMAAAAIEDFDEQHVDPLVELMSEHDISVEQADEYLHARHAKEANARLREINPDRKDNQALSGMSDQEAEQILDRINRGQQAQVYKRIGRMVDAITKARRDLLIEAGLETEDTIAAWEEAYQHYVPLMREGKGDAMPRKGRGFEVRGGQKIRAGSTREVVNIMANVVAQHEATIVRAEKAKVSRAFLEFAKSHKGPWKINVPEKTASFDEDGLIQYRANPLGYMLAENVLAVRVDGKDHHITFDERDLDGMKILSALKNLDAADMGAVTRAVAKISRWLAVINTSLNPEFIISNFARDIQTAAYNMADTEADAIRMKAIKQVGSAFKGIREYQDNNRDTEWARWFNRFRNAGGQTGWVQSYETIQDREKALISKIEDMKHGKVRSVKRGLTAAFDYIADMNTAVENAIRLSVFKNLIEANVPESKAAKIAKELTVNFNRKGNMGPVLNAFYLFYNASIQGSARLIMAGAKSRKVRMLMGATIVFAAALDIMNRATGGDDDDGENRYDKIAPWIKDRNMIIMLPGNNGHIQIPLPWGYNIFHVMGQAAGEVLTKKNNDTMKSALRVGGSIVSAFNPMGGESSLLQVVSPTIIDPFVQWAENKDWSGRKLRPAASPYAEKPSSQTYWHSARVPSKWIAKTLNELTGGDEVRPGKIDISPEAIDLAIDTVTGGAGKFISNLISTPIKYAKGEDVETYEIPFLRRIYGKAGKQVLTQQYYENMDAVRLVQRQLSHYKNDPAKVREIAKEYKAEVRLIGRMKATQKAMKDLKDQRKAAEMIKDPDVRKAREKKIEETMQKIMGGFNKNYNAMKNKE